METRNAVPAVVLALLAGIAMPIPGYSQRYKVAPQNMYYRVYAVVPMTNGNGSKADPKRPMFAPGLVAAGPQQQPTAAAGQARKGIIGFTSTMSDDGKFALVEYTAVDPAALRPIVTANRPDVKAFEAGKVKLDDVEKEFRKYKKNFTLKNFGAGLQ
jgi:hypothetical protein